MVFDASNTVYSGNTAWEEGSGLEMKPGAGTIQDNYDTLYTSEATATPLLTNVGETNEHWRGLSQMYIVIIALYSVLLRVC